SNRVVALSNALEPFRMGLEHHLRGSNLAKRYRVLEANQTSAYWREDQLQISLSREAVKKGPPVAELQAILAPFKDVPEWPDAFPSRRDERIPEIAAKLRVALEHYPEGESFREFWGSLEKLLTVFNSPWSTRAIYSEMNQMYGERMLIDRALCTRLLTNLLEELNAQGLLDYGWFLQVIPNEPLRWYRVRSYQVVREGNARAVWIDIEDPSGQSIPLLSSGGMSIGNYVLFDSGRLDSYIQKSL